MFKNLKTVLDKLTEYQKITNRKYRVLHPRPAYILITGYQDKIGIMPASWVSPISEEPERVVVAWDKESYTLELLKKISYLTINVVGPEDLDILWKTGRVSGHEVDKVKEFGIQLEKASDIPSYRLKSPLGWMETKVYKIIGDLAEDIDLVILDVISAYASKDDYDMRYGWQLRKANILLHASGRAFVVPGRMYFAK